MEDRHAEAIVSTLSLQLPFLDSLDDILTVTETALQTFERNGSLSVFSLYLLPSLVTILDAFDDHHVESETDHGTSDRLSGITYRVLDHTWRQDRIAVALDALRRLPLKKSLRAMVVQKAARSAKEADMQDLPSIVHQAIIMSGLNGREDVLVEIVHLVSWWEEHVQSQEASEAHRRQLHEIEGAILLHLEMAAKHDDSIAKAWLKRIKSMVEPSTPFAFALSLTIAGIPRYERESLALLCQRIKRCETDGMMARTAPWLFPRSIQDETINVPLIELERNILKCVSNSAHGQGILTQPLVNLGVSLLDTEIKSRLGSMSRSSKIKPEPDHRQELSNIAHLGMKLLMETFVAQKDARSEILSQCSARLISSESEMHAMSYVSVIREIALSFPDLMERRLTELRTVLECLTLLPPAAAEAFVAALWPLCRQRREIADAVIVTLRKAMFAKDTSPRIIAARGFLVLVQIELQSAANTAGNDHDGALDVAMVCGSCSQTAPTASQIRAFGAPDAAGATMLHELLSFLRRCLSQQPEIREIVYDGLPSLLQADPQAAEHIAELLLPHFAMFFEPDESLPAPLRLETCSRISHDGKMTRLLEPLPQLLSCIRRVLALGGWSAGDEDEESIDAEAEKENASTRSPDSIGKGAAYHDHDKAVSVSAGRSLKRMFLSLRRRLTSCPLEDFSFDLSTNFNLNEAVGEFNYITASMLLGGYEVIMEDVVDEIDAHLQLAEASPHDYHASSEQSHAVFFERIGALGSDMMALFANHRRLSNLMVEGCKGTKARQHVEGLTQAVGGVQRRSGPISSNNHNNKQISRGASYETLHASSMVQKAKSALLVHPDQRMPAISGRCLCRLLDAVLQDGLVNSTCAEHVPVDSHVQLARDTAFQKFVLRSSHRYLEMHEEVDVGLGGRASPGTRWTMHPLNAANLKREEEQTESEPNPKIISNKSFAECDEVAAELFHTAKTTILATARESPRSKEKDSLLHTAVASLERSIVRATSSRDRLKLILSRSPPSSDTGIAHAGLEEFSSSDAFDAETIRRLPFFKSMLDVLLENQCLKELEPFIRSLEMVINTLPIELVFVMSRWIDSAWYSAPAESTSTHVATAKSLLSIRLRCHEAAGKNGDAAVLQELGREISAVIDRELEKSANASMEAMASLRVEPTSTIPMLSEKTMQAMMVSAVNHIDRSLGVIEWVLAQLKSDVNSFLHGHWQSPSSNDDAALNSQTNDRSTWENLVFGRLEALVRSAYQLSCVNATGPFVELLSKLLTKIYKHLSLAAKTQIAHRGEKQIPPGEGFQSMVRFVNSSLTPKVYQLITDIQVTANRPPNDVDLDKTDVAARSTDDGGGGRDAARKRKNAQSAALLSRKRSQKELQTVPNLVYQMEDWEKWLLRLSKAGKINLLMSAKRAISRDFRVRSVGVKERGEGAQRDGESKRARRGEDERPREADVQDLVRDVENGSRKDFPLLANENEMPDGYYSDRADEEEVEEEDCEDEEEEDDEYGDEEAEDAGHRCAFVDIEADGASDVSVDADGFDALEDDGIE